MAALDLPSTNIEYDSSGNLITANNISHKSSSTGITTTFEAGIDIVNVDVVQVLLGTGNDTFNINTPAATIDEAPGDGLQADHVRGRGRRRRLQHHQCHPQPRPAGQLYANQSGSGTEYNSKERTTGKPNGNGVVFSNFGFDTINAAGATGHRGHRRRSGRQHHHRRLRRVNWIAGGQGTDTITASGATNYIFAEFDFYGRRPA